MPHLTPRWCERKGCWQIDLRAWNLGRRDLPIHDRTDQIGALHAAYAVWEKRKGQAPPEAQLSLAGAVTGDYRVADAIAGYLRERDHSYASAGGERWWLEVTAQLRRELGHLRLASLAPPAGAKLLRAYRDDVRTGGNLSGCNPKLRRVAPKTMQDRLICLAKVLRWACEDERRWILALPVFPSAKLSPDERLRNPRDKWIAEDDFRATRRELYNDDCARRGIERHLRARKLPCDAAAVRDFVERRKMYLSWAFYTGMRKHDLDLLCDRSVSPDFACFARFARKTGGARPEMQVSGEAIPARDERGRAYALLGDLESERERLGRHYRRGEQICGGPWKNVCRVVAEAAKRAGVEPWNLMDARRSFVYHKAAAGVEEWRMVRLLGHRDSRMIRAVYLQHLPRLQRDEAGAIWLPPVAAAGPGGRVLAFQVPSQSQNRPQEGT